MSKNEIAVGIDIGTYNVKVVVAESSRNDSALPKIIGVGYAESKGMRHGYIINQSDAVRSIRKAIREAERSSRFKISKVFLGVGGIGLNSHVSTGNIMISRADNEITQLDLDKALAEAQNSIPKNISVNRNIIHAIPISYKIDGKDTFGHPIGMKGVKLEVKVLFITCLEHHLSELIQAVEDAGVEIIDVMASPLAASLVTISRSEKIAGCVLTNIGSETVSIVVYEDDIPISMEIFPVGSNDITKDIALGLQISLDEAEKVKIKEADKSQKKKLDEIVSARVSDILELIEAHLKKIGKNGLLPAGIVITGGGSGITTLEDMSKAVLKLPAKISRIACDEESAKCLDVGIKVKDSTWAVAYGLTVFGLYSDSDSALSVNLGTKIFKKTKHKVVSFIKQFLP